MDTSLHPETAERFSPIQRALAYSVHLLTASGIIFAFLAMAELRNDAPNVKRVFIWFVCATLVDAIDGPLARLFHVKKRAPRIDGRTIDDIIDYLTFTFIPLMLIWRMGWVPQPAALWVVPAMFASLLGFANTHAKEEKAGFFLGFPSYWNIVAFYAGLWAQHFSPWVPAIIIVFLTILTVLPVRFIYPNLAPQPWKLPVLIGALVWLILILVMLPTYPVTPKWLMWGSLIYPVFYVLLSIYLDLNERIRRNT